MSGRYASYWNAFLLVLRRERQIVSTRAKVPSKCMFSEHGTKYFILNKVSQEYITIHDNGNNDDGNVMGLPPLY